MAIMEPIIGSGFDAIAAQRAGWAGFNRGVEENNIARLAASQQNANNWLAQVAAMRDAAVARNQNLALARDESARRDAWTRYQTEADRAKWAEDMAFRRSSFATQLGETRAEREAALRAQEEDRKLKREVFAKNLEDQAVANAASLAAATEKSDAIQRRIEDIKSQTSKIQEDLTAEQSKRRGKQDPMAMMTWQNQQKALAAELPRLESQKAQSDAFLASLHSRVLNQGFDINPDTGELTHPATNRRWNFKQAVKKAEEKLTGGGMMNPLLVGPAMSIVAANMPQFAGFGTSRSSAPEPAAVPAVPVSSPTVPIGTNGAPTRVWTRDASGKLVLQQ